MSMVPKRKVDLSWDGKFGEIEIIDEGRIFNVEVGYVHSMKGLYIRVWENNRGVYSFCGGNWVDRWKDHGDWIPDTLSDKCIDYAQRMEKMKAFL
jgi:hypothetical protein